jgi:hypothetical protein
MKNQEKIRKPTRKPHYTAEHVHDRVRRHLSDKNSVITDEDIKNVKTELTIRGETAPDNNRNQDE